jgi:hypothetical protein
VPSCWARAHIRLSRGELSGAVADATTARELAAGGMARDAQMWLKFSVFYSYVLAEGGEPREADRVVDEWLGALRSSPYALGWAWQHLTEVLLRLGRLEDLRAVLAVAVPVRWVEAARFYAGGEPERAADVYARIGTPPAEARARLRAAERLLGNGRRDEADRQLETALAFWRSVGASRYIREAETLLAASV